MQLLMDHGLDINLTSRSGETVLHHAIANANIKLVQYLIESGAELNCDETRYRYSSANVLQRCYKQAPLHLAAEERHFEICQLLIIHGCDLEFLRNTKVNDTLSRVINSGELELIMVLVHAAGLWNWTSLIHYNQLSTFCGQERLDCIWEWLQEASMKPMMLKSQCRLLIRKKLKLLAQGTSILSYVQELELPQFLQDFCALKIL